jgi:hypothetical protein
MTWFEALEQIKKGKEVRLADWPETVGVYYDENEDGIPDPAPQTDIVAQRADFERFKSLLYLRRGDNRHKGYWPLQMDFAETNWIINEKPVTTSGPAGSDEQLPDTEEK